MSEKLAEYVAEVYRIAEEVHKGGDEEYISEMIREAASKFGLLKSSVSREVRSVFNREFSNEA